MLAYFRNSRSWLSTAARVMTVASRQFAGFSALGSFVKLDEALLKNMRIFLPTMFVASAVLGASACNEDSEPVQCKLDEDCNLDSGGACVAAPTGNRWCASSDPSCESGYRYMEDSHDIHWVGDDLAGVCVAPTITPVKPLSCENLAKNCGANSDGDCCESPVVPGGTFFRSYDVAGDANSGAMNSPATLTDFRLDRYEVTVGRFRAFVAAGMGTQAQAPGLGAGAHPSIAGSGWQASWNAQLPADTTTLTMQLQCGGYATWSDVAGGPNEVRPINCVTWSVAMAFCAWDGGYLPTEAEWNYAAAGGSEQRAYPWSAPASSLTLDYSHASYANENVDCLADGKPACEITDLLTVGSKAAGDGRWGHSDMAGNVAEWTLDSYAAYASTCTDCANLTATDYHVFRGGSFFNSGSEIRAGVRNSGGLTLRNGLNGFRCARKAN